MNMHSFAGCCFLVKNVSRLSSLYKTTTNSSTFTLSNIMHMHPRSYKATATQCVWSPCNTLLWHGSNMVGCGDAFSKWAQARYLSNTSLDLKPDGDVVIFHIGELPGKTVSSMKDKKVKRFKMSRKAKLNELRFYRLKAKKKMRSPNPEVRIRYRLEKAKRKEEWLIEKLKKFNVPKAPAEKYDPEILTEEEKFYLKRTGEKKKNYVPVGRRGVFGGVVLNMHLHWKKHETVKVICKPCKVGQVYEYAEELAWLSKGIVIDIKPNNTIIFTTGGKTMYNHKLCHPLIPFPKARHFFAGCCFLVKNVSRLSSLYKTTTNSSTFTLSNIMHMYPRSYKATATQCVWSPCDTLLWHGSNMVGCGDAFSKWAQARYLSNTSLELKPGGDVVRFNIGELPGKIGSSMKEKKKVKRFKMSRKAKLNELRFYRLKAKKKMRSPNPEVRIRYRLEKAKRKEEWLIEKLKKFNVPKAPAEKYDPEILTEEEKFYLKRTGEKKKNYVPVGRRGVFGGVVLNMHLHWKKHETVKVICKPCKVGQVYEYAEELARLSKGIVIDIKPNNTIIFYRGKNYVQPQVMSPLNTLSKSKALEKYTYEQSLEHTSQFIEKLEKELEEYHKHLAQYKKRKESRP